MTKIQARGARKLVKMSSVSPHTSAMTYAAMVTTSFVKSQMGRSIIWWRKITSCLSWYSDISTRMKPCKQQERSGPIYMRNTWNLYVVIITMISHSILEIH